MLVNGVIVQEQNLTGSIAPMDKYPISDVKRDKDKMRLYPHNRVWAGSKILHASQRSIAVVTSIGTKTQKGHMLQPLLAQLPIKSVSDRLRRDASFVLAFIVVIYLSMWLVRACYFAVHSFANDGLDVSWHVQGLVTMAFMAEDFVYNEIIWICFDLGLVHLNS